MCLVNRVFCFCCKTFTKVLSSIDCSEAICSNITIKNEYGEMCEKCLLNECFKHMNNLKFGWYRCNDIQILPVTYENK